MHSEENRRYKAIYSDGKTASSRDLVIVMGPEGLRLCDEHGAPFETWQYDQITSTKHLHRGESAQLGHKDLPGARLYVAETEFASLLIEQIPHMSMRAHNKRLLVPITLIGLLLGAIVGGIWFTGFSVPQAIAGMIPDKVRKGFGDQVVASLAGGRAVCANPKGAIAFRKLVGRIRAGAGQSDKFDVQVMPLGMMNAFAAPGERIVVSKKLIDFVRSPEELAGVIAHEMGHGIKRHPEAGIVRALGISAAISIAFGGTPGSFGDVGAMLLQMKYSRTAERQADTIALDILKKAQIPAKPFAAFFARLERKREGGALVIDITDDKAKASDKAPSHDKKPKTEDKNTGLTRTLQLLSSHPASRERIRLINRQPRWPTRPILSATEWQAVGKICDPR